ncbi:MAG: hypothetical protein ABS81_01020 [Pseudonocardia sp. SCN 72-86]|nr:MAG: hypothetical protein ABS81_01020 [Pseudonocardia sp. SCN 72-86]
MRWHLHELDPGWEPATRSPWRPKNLPAITEHLPGVERFRSRHAFAHHNRTAPVPVWSSNRHRFRHPRTGNRQLNAAIHRLAITQAHHHPQTREMPQRRRAGGHTKTESIRVLKRRLSDVVHRALLADVDTGTARS